ncbi:MAG: hypothetical protein JSU66_09795, partial [Deltaproteobacteria bacterium]
ARRFARDAPVITDDANRLQMDSPRAMRNSLTAAQADRVFEAYDPLREDLHGLDRYRLVRRLAARGERQRALRLAHDSPDPLERQLCIGVVRQRAGDPRAALAAAEAVLAQDPAAPAARFWLASLHRPRLIRGDPELRALTEGAADPDAAVFEGWRRLAEGDGDGLRALEARLARARPGDEAFAESLRLRARWRLQVGVPERALEARALLDQVILEGGTLQDLFARAEASAAAGDPVGALDALGEVLDRAPRSAPGRRLARAAQELLASLPEDASPAATRVRERVDALLGAGGS